MDEFGFNSSIFSPPLADDAVLDGALYGLEEDADGCVTAVALDGSSVSLDDHIVGLL